MMAQAVVLLFGVVIMFLAMIQMNRAASNLDTSGMIRGFWMTAFGCLVAFVSGKI
jgi:hypothetical protein